MEKRDFLFVLSPVDYKNVFIRRFDLVCSGAIFLVNRDFSYVSKSSKSIQFLNSLLSKSYSNPRLFSKSWAIFKLQAIKKLIYENKSMGPLVE